MFFLLNRINKKLLKTRSQVLITCGHDQQSVKSRVMLFLTSGKIKIVIHFIYKELLVSRSTISKSNNTVIQSPFLHNVLSVLIRIYFLLHMKQHFTISLSSYRHKAERSFFNIIICEAAFYSNINNNPNYAIDLTRNSLFIRYRFTRVQWAHEPLVTTIQGPDILHIFSYHYNI